MIPVALTGILTLGLVSCGSTASKSRKVSVTSAPTHVLRVQSATADATIQVAMGVVENYRHIYLHLAVGAPLPSAGSGTEAATVQDDSGNTFGLIAASDDSMVSAIPNPLGPSGDRTGDQFTRRPDGTYSHETVTWHTAQQQFHQQAGKATGVMSPVAFHHPDTPKFRPAVTVSGCPLGGFCCDALVSDLHVESSYPVSPILYDYGALWCNFINASTDTVEIEIGNHSDGTWTKAGGGVSCCGNGTSNIVWGAGPCDFVWTLVNHWARSWAWVVPDNFLYDPPIVPGLSAIAITLNEPMPCDYPWG